MGSVAELKPALLQFGNVAACTPLCIGMKWLPAVMKLRLCLHSACLPSLTATFLLVCAHFSLAIISWTPSSPARRRGCSQRRRSAQATQANEAVDEADRVPIPPATHFRTQHNELVPAFGGTAPGTWHSYVLGRSEKNASTCASRGYRRPSRAGGNRASRRNTTHPWPRALQDAICLADPLASLVSPLGGGAEAEHTFVVSPLELGQSRSLLFWWTGLLQSKQCL